MPAASMALALCLAGVAGLALAMERHHRQVWHRGPSQRRRLLLRAGGIAGQGAALAVCARAAGWATGPVLWLGLLTVAALVATLVLAWRPRRR